MKNVIVTGATGFIGSWLVEDLLKHDYNVTLIVRNREKLLPHISDRCTVIETVLFDELLESKLAGKEYSTFFHLAWGGASNDKKNNIDLQLDNIKMSLRALDIANSIGCQTFIAAGTVAEYVFSPDTMDVYEKQAPNDMYGAAKVSTHYFLEVRARQLHQDFIWMIIPSTFGERRNDDNIITYTIRTLLKKEVPEYGMLNQMWDFLYVSEVARAIRLIGEKGFPGRIYGIGSGVYRPLRDYIVDIRDMIDPKLELGIGNKSEFNDKTFSSCVNIEELKQDTGFVPQVSFIEGITRTIQYFRKESNE